jgi:hypothetical protein
MWLNLLQVLWKYGLFFYQGGLPLRNSGPLVFLIPGLDNPQILPSPGPAIDYASPRWKPTVFQNHRIDDLPAKDASPPPEMFVRTIEFFVNHMITTAMALHRDLLFPLNLFEHRGKEIVMSFLIFESFFKQERRGDVPFLLSLFDYLLIKLNRYRLYRWYGDLAQARWSVTPRPFKGPLGIQPVDRHALSTCLVGAPRGNPSAGCSTRDPGK